jgi:hypothetical protein
MRLRIVKDTASGQKDGKREDWILFVPAEQTHGFRRI